MDYMDVEEVLDVPDTPDRLGTQNKNDRGLTGNRGCSSVVFLSENSDITENAARLALTNKFKLDDKGETLSFVPPKGPRTIKKPECHSYSGVSAFGDSSSSKSSHLFRKTGVNIRARDYKHMEKEKKMYSNQSSSGKNRAIVDLTEQNGHARESGKALRHEASKYQAQDVRLCTSLKVVENPSKMNNTCKGKEKMNDMYILEADLDCGRSMEGDVSTSLNTATLPRFINQKRLVRNGCISPNNIAKAKQLAEYHENGSGGVVQNATSTTESASEIDIRDLVAEDTNSHVVKGKAVLKYPQSLQKADSESRHLFTGSTKLDILDGWRSTRNRTIKMPGKSLNLSRRKNNLSVKQQEFCVVRSDNRSSERTFTNYSGHQNAISHQLGSSCPAAQTSSCFLSQANQVNGLCGAEDALAKRQKHSLTSSDHGQCSTSAIDYSDVLVLGSPEEPSITTLKESQSGHDPFNMGSIIEIDEFSPKGRHDSSHSLSSVCNDQSDARARQVEADEMLARELQEQLYNESPGIGQEEIDAHVAMTLQQEQESQESLLGHNTFHPRHSLASIPRSQNSEFRRGSQARLSRRMDQLRRRFRSQSSGVSARDRNSLFDPNVGVDMRIDILEALEAFSDMGMAHQILQVQRDFNENDYEMLLALDEHNHQAGASINQINGLPQSTVQNQNFEESCAICLETPTAGDIIRHLPCLHKFHKDCIDPWLRRKTSCPVCKSSIT